MSEFTDVVGPAMTAEFDQTEAFYGEQLDRLVAKFGEAARKHGREKAKVLFFAAVLSGLNAYELTHLAVGAIERLAKQGGAS